MTSEDAQKLETGDRVTYAAGTPDEIGGTVLGRSGYFAEVVTIMFDDQKPGAVHVRDMRNYDRR